VQACFIINFDLSTTQIAELVHRTSSSARPSGCLGWYPVGPVGKQRRADVWTVEETPVNFVQDPAVSLSCAPAVRERPTIINPLAEYTDPAAMTGFGRGDTCRRQGEAKKSTRGGEASMACNDSLTKGAGATLEWDGWGGDRGTGRTKRCREAQYLKENKNVRTTARVAKLSQNQVISVCFYER